MKNKIIYIIVLMGLASQLNAGLLGFAKEKIKDKAKDKIVDVTIDKGKEVYKTKRVIRKETEAKKGVKGTLTKTEDVVIDTAKTAKEAAIGSFGGQKNVDYLKRGKGYMGEALKGELKD